MSSLMSPTTPSATRPLVPDEPPLKVGEIQGNIVAGFNKDFQTLLFLRIDEPTVFKPWLARFADLVATADEVISFNRLFKEISHRRGYRGSVKASWINIAFSHAGLAKLTGEADLFTDDAFRDGIVGNPEQWLVRDGDGGADVLVIVAADAFADLESEVARVEESIFSPVVKGNPVRSGASVVFKQEGRVQFGALAGHEHFGFLDGVSQPGLRGRISDNPCDVLTLRLNPDDPNQGKPGQDLVWPGEFVFGYPGQNGNRNAQAAGPNSLTDGAGGRVAPDWAKNGSYLVFLRLQQDVSGFHSFLRQQAVRLNLAPEAVGAKLVGRWASGAPTMRAPLRDDPLLADDENANNHFQFQVPTAPTQNPAGEGQYSDTEFPQSTGDPSGDQCPLSSHIRKAYPRDDVAGAAEVQQHRLLRRGIPYGPSSRSTPASPVKDDLDRGLLFMAYMTSITDQFEFVLENWVNGADFSGLGVGVDPFLGGLQGADGGRERAFSVRVDGHDYRLTASKDWVTPTGGGYFFSPSICALKTVLAA